jgi:TetR/AcrR family transcriptional repressor of lmrAB and yxaGH operons
LPVRPLRHGKHAPQEIWNGTTTRSPGATAATVALEEAAISDTIAAACAEALAKWRDALTESVTAHGAARPDAESLATLVLAGMEGALLLSRAARDPGPLRTVGKELATVLRARLHPAVAERG